MNIKNATACIIITLVLSGIICAQEKPVLEKNTEPVNKEQAKLLKKQKKIKARLASELKRLEAAAIDFKAALPPMDKGVLDPLVKAVTKMVQQATAFITQLNKPVDKPIFENVTSLHKDTKDEKQAGAKHVRMSCWSMQLIPELAGASS